MNFITLYQHYLKFVTLQFDFLFKQRFDIKSKTALVKQLE